MGMYHVVWEIDLDADSHRDAAERALTIQRKRDSSATVFDVIEADRADPVRIDFMEDMNTEAGYDAAGFGTPFDAYELVSQRDALVWLLHDLCAALPDGSKALSKPAQTARAQGAALAAAILNHEAINPAAVQDQLKRIGYGCRKAAATPSNPGNAGSPCSTTP